MPGRATPARPPRASTAAGSSTTGRSPTPQRHDLPRDYLSQIKMAYLDEGPAPTHHFYGWIA